MTQTTVTIDGAPVNLTSALSLTNNDNNVSQQFSATRFQAGVVSGTGNDSFNVTIAFDIDAFSRERMTHTLNELLEEREGVKDLLG